jgi:hypothetical protein
MYDPSLRYRKPAGILHAELDDEEVLLNPETGIYHLVNRTGRFLLTGWRRGKHSARRSGRSRPGPGEICTVSGGCPVLR